MTRKRWLPASAVIVLIAVALVLLFWENGDSSVSELIDGQTAQEEGLTPDMQTPVYVPPAETEPDASETQPSEATDDAPIEASASTKYNFKSSDDALNFYAELVAKLADQMKEDSTINPPPGKNKDGEAIYDDTHVSWEDAWYGGVAAGIVLNQIFENGIDSELAQALIPHINDWKPEDWSPPHLMVRAGRWPSAALRDEIILPNGQTLDLTTMTNKRVVIRFRTPNPFWIEPQQQIENLKKGETEILSRLASGAVSETESDLLQHALLAVQALLKNPPKSQRYIEQEWRYAQGMGDPSDVDSYEEAVFDLGVIEEDMSAK
ncbi:MAG: hypothetical protein OXT69_01710 [Candidatus Poribacteria bacterium]|nr:hypothetical protein [Candidatus Poribacteria bacterium]